MREIIEYLLLLRFTEKEIQNIVEINPNLNDADVNDIKNNIEYLRRLNCQDFHVKNIVLNNPFYLTQSITEIRELVKYLIEYGFTHLHLLFDSNPEILNMNINDIKNHLSKKENKFTKEEIIAEIEANPFILEEDNE